jgi:hypothetical protein
MCDAWREDFLAFYDWAMASGYADHLTIDRIDNDKGYSPENCQWITKASNQSNKRSTLRVEYKGKNINVAQLSRETGISEEVLQYRYHKGLRGDKLVAPIDIRKSRRKVGS